MKRTRRLGVLVGLMVALVLSQTPVRADTRLADKSTSPDSARVLQVITLRMGKCTPEQAQQVADDLKLLTPDELNLLAANPQMMQVGGRHFYGADEAVNVALIVLAVVVVAGLIVLVAVASSCD